MACNIYRNNIIIFVHASKKKGVSRMASGMNLLHILRIATNRGKAHKVFARMSPLIRLDGTRARTVAIKRLR